MLQLNVNGQQYTGWLSAQVTMSLEGLARGFALGVADETDSLPIHNGDACTLLYAGQPLLTGFVDLCDQTIGPDGRDIRIEGRDRLGDLVDCSAILPGGQLRNQTVDAICRALVAPFGIGLKINGPTGPVLPVFQVEQGETVHAAIERVIKNRGLLATSDGKQLVLTKAGSQTVPTRLVLGQNIASLSVQDNAREQFSQYIVKGQSTTTALRFGPNTHAVVGKATKPKQVSARKPTGKRRKLRKIKIKKSFQSTSTDTKASRYRPLVLLPDDISTLQTAASRADWEKTTREAKGIRLTCELVGWQTGVTTGPVWLPNQLVDVEADEYTGRYLIAEVTLNVTETAETTSLTLVPPGAYA
jgi:prophage tail gpP-like protein